MTTPCSAAAAKSTWYAWLPVCATMRSPGSASKNARVSRVLSRFVTIAS